MRLIHLAASNGSPERVINVAAITDATRTSHGVTIYFGDPESEITELSGQQAEEFWRRLVAEATEPRQSAADSVPDGCALVPVVPTAAMLDASWTAALAENPAGVWRDIIAAAPAMSTKETPNA